MAKIEGRPLDAGLASLHGKDESATTEWWKQRLTLIAAIPTDVARAGALVPQLRELARFPADERRRLTKSRVQAFLTLPGDQRQRILEARKLTYAIDDQLLRSDDALTAEVAPEVPGAGDILRQMER
jgi:hypothetical protein